MTDKKKNQPHRIVTTIEAERARAALKGNQHTAPPAPKQTAKRKR